MKKMILENVEWMRVVEIEDSVEITEETTKKITKNVCEQKVAGRWAIERKTIVDLEQEKTPGADDLLFETPAEFVGLSAEEIDAFPHVDADNVQFQKEVQEEMGKTKSWLK